MGAYPEQQKERFHQNVMVFERRFLGQYNENMRKGYIPGLIKVSNRAHI